MQEIVPEFLSTADFYDLSKKTKKKRDEFFFTSHTVIIFIPV